MASKTSQNVRLGLFVLGGVVILVGFIFFIGANQSLFGSSTKVVTTFKNISGLQVGANVRFAGINVGTVDDIRIITDTTVEVTLLVDNQAARYVKTDSRVMIGSDGIMGDKVVNLSSGSPDKDRVKNGAKLKSEEPLEFDQIMAQGQAMAASLSTITGNMADITNSIKEGKGTIGMLLYDEQTANTTRSLLAGVNRSVQGLGQNMDNLKAGTQAFSENMKAVQSNVLVRGYFKKKERAVQDSIKKVEGARKDSIDKELKRKYEESRKAAREKKKISRMERRQERRNRRRGQPQQQTAVLGTQNQEPAVNTNGEQKVTSPQGDQ